MVFSSPIFLFAFLPLALALYFVVPKRMRNVVLLVESLIFYIWGSGALVVVLLASVAVNYVTGSVVERGVTTGKKNLVRAGVTIAVITNLAVLGYFKYANWIVAQLNEIGEALGIGTIAWTNVILPIGISFYTFQSMSYTIDISRKRVKHLSNPIDFAVYVALFPQLIAGPIVRYHEIAAQLKSRVLSSEGFAEGAVRFIHGLAKKVIIADNVAAVADVAFRVGGEGLSLHQAWLGIVAYTLQIYFDFSGYSDMAIGLGKMMGFTFPENFKHPYSAVSVTDFWRRWHITLSNWFRDYVYIPLGGSAGTTHQTYRNLWIVFLLTGIWHGANWTFVVWGAYHGMLLIVERITNQRPVGDDVSYEPIRRVVVLFFVIMGWVVFRAPDLAAAGAYWQALLVPKAVSSAAFAATVTTSALIALGVGCVIFFVPRSPGFGTVLQHSSSRPMSVVRVALVYLMFPYVAIQVAAGTFSPFLYFQF